MLSRLEKQLFSLITGAFASRVLAIAAKRDLFSWLSEGRTFEEVQAFLGFSKRGSRAFIDVLCESGLLQCKNGRLLNSDLSETLLVRGRISDQRCNVGLFDRLFSGCAALEQALETGSPVSREYGYFFGTSTGSYPDDMDGSGIIPSLLLGEFWDFSEARNILDVGGCLGRTAHALAARYSHLFVTVFDLPEICVIGEASFGNHPASTGRVQFHSGSFFDGEFPSGFDVVCLVRVLHDWPEQEAIQILRKAHTALRFGGHVLILETLRASLGKTSPTAFVDLLMLLISPAGELRTKSTMQKLLRSAGFRHVRTKSTAYLYSLISAEK